MQTKFLVSMPNIFVPKHFHSTSFHHLYSSVASFILDISNFIDHWFWLQSTGVAFQC